MRKERQKNITKECLGDILVSLVIAAQYINSVVCIVLNRTDGIISTLFFIEGLLIVLHLCVNRFVIRLERKHFLFFLLIVSGYVLTQIFKEKQSSISAMEFMCRCIIPYIVGATISFNPKRVLKILMSMLIPGLPFISRIFAKGNVGGYDAITMGTSYAILPVIMSGVVYYIVYNKSSSVFEKILFVVSGIYTLFFITMSYRGALFSLLLVVFLLLITRNKKSYSVRKVIISCILILLAIIFFIFRDQIVIFLVDFFASIGIRIATLDKSLILASQADIMHGRFDVYRAALNGIKESPWIGHGYATFRYNTGYVFPHNMILEMLFDFGVPVGLFIVLYVLGNSIKKAKYYQKNDMNMYSFILMIMCCSLPRVMISAETWIVIILWFLVGFVSREQKDKSSVA